MVRSRGGEAVYNLITKSQGFSVFTSWAVTFTVVFSITGKTVKRGAWVGRNDLSSGNIALVKCSLFFFLSWRVDQYHGKHWDYFKIFAPLFHNF